jgi:lipopolysaccharide export system permease protein
MNAGVGPWGWARPVLLFVTPVVLIIAFVSLEGIAWGARKQAEYEDVLASAKNQISSLTPGVFSEDKQGKRVVFVENISRDGRHVENVFVQSLERGRMGVTVASQGVLTRMDSGDTFLVLEKGKRYEGIPGAADFWMASFKTYAVRIPTQAVAERGVNVHTMKASELLHNPAPVNMAEWVWRLGYPISALLLCLMAVPLSYANPRAGRSLNVIYTILVYAAYNNFVGLSQGWVERAQMGATESLLLVHGTMLLLLLAFYWRRFRGPWAS